MTVARKVLVVDDEPLFCEMMRTFLGARGYSTLEAPDGDKALELYRRERPGVVLLDVRMPGKDGMKALRELRAFDPEAKVIIITAAQEEEMAKQARSEGALEYITKPIDLKSLEITLRRSLASPSATTSVRGRRLAPG